MRVFPEIEFNGSFGVAQNSRELGRNGCAIPDPRERIVIVIDARFGSHSRRFQLDAALIGHYQAIVIVHERCSYVGAILIGHLQNQAILSGVLLDNRKLTQLRLGIRSAKRPKSVISPKDFIWFAGCLRQLRFCWLD